MVNNLQANSETEREPTSGNDDNVNGNTLSGCSSNDDINPSKYYARRRKCNENVQVCEKQKKRESYQRISMILRKSEEARNAEEQKQLEANADIVRQIIKRREHIANTRERVLEKEDPPDVIEEKARKLANVLSRAQHLVCYTGAGISTSARIPDYRGSQGIWTMLQQGKQIGEYDLSLADPTFTHMSLFELHRRNILRYTLSQNCDGLHLRSGLPRKLLSEVHGNMYIEVCKYCKPNVEYWRLFDTTELTARYNHKTNRRCHFCFKPLIDTIVHFGERGRLKWPLNWESASKNAEKADVILCLGSSLKVLKKYTWLWQMDRPKSKRPKIYIVNLQWTPKDKGASLKINGKCDEVMKLVMDFMNIKVAAYDRRRDPIFFHASLLLREEMHTVSQPMLKRHSDENEAKMETDESDKVHETDGKQENGKENAHGDKQVDGSGGMSEEEQKPVKQEQANEKEAANEYLPKNESDLKIEENVVIKKEPDEIAIGSHSENPIETPQNDEFIQNEITNGKSEICQEKNAVEMKPSEIERLEDNKQKDCSNINNDFDVKLPRGSQCDGTGQINSQSHEISIQQVHDNNKLISNDNDNKIETTQINCTQTSHKSNADKVTTHQAIKSELPFDRSDDAEKSDEGYLKTLINYYRAIEGVVPHWYDVNYAYSGLHSIINPPPNEVDIWSTIIIPIFHLNRNLAECEFCFDNYAEDKCQFYTPQKEFHVSVAHRRNGKRILCECCDYEDFVNDEEQTSLDEIDGSEEPKTNSEEDDTDSSRPKRFKTDHNDHGKMATQRVVQPGWYGKGYRKTTKRKKSKKMQLR